MGFLAHQSWSPQNVNVVQCGPADRTINLAEDGNEVLGYHTWENTNPGEHAYVRAQPTINDDPLPVSVNTGHPYVRQVDGTTYEAMVGPDGARHTIEYHMATADLPVGQGMDYGVNVLAIRQQELDAF